MDSQEPLDLSNWSTRLSPCPSYPLISSSASPASSIYSVDAVNTVLNEQLTERSSLRKVPRRRSSDSNSCFENSSHFKMEKASKPSESFYFNRKQCHETFKKSGANMKKKCEELQGKTGCKIYYRAEFTTFSGKSITYEFGDLSSFYSNDNLSERKRPTICCADDDTLIIQPIGA